MAVLNSMNIEPKKFYTTTFKSANKCTKDIIESFCIAHRYSIDSIQNGIDSLIHNEVNPNKIIVTKHDNSGRPIKSIMACQNWKSFFINN